MDTSATFYREIVATPQPAYVYQGRHDRIDQFGATLAKDLGPAVFKAETVYTTGRGYSVNDPGDTDGVVRQTTLDIITALDFSLPSDTRLNLQLLNRTFFDHDPSIIYRRNEPGFSALLNRKFSERLEAEVLWITSLARSDGLTRARFMWTPAINWRWIVGVDAFNGPPLGYFGQFSNSDRIYTELHYKF
jgi:hypothetical protein